MSQGKRKRSSSLPNSSSPSSGKVEVDESLETGRDSNPSEFCYACGTNLKKNKLRRNVLNHSHNPPQSGKYPVLIDEPAVSDSESLCPRCYWNVVDSFTESHTLPQSPDEPQSRHFIGDNSVRTWCSRVIVSIALLTSLVSFFVDNLIKAGVNVEHTLCFEDGIAILKIKIGDKFYEWTSSTFVVNPGNRLREYTINTFLSNAIYLSGNRITALFRYLDLLGVWHQSKSAIHGRNERQLRPAIAKYFEKMMVKVKSILCVPGKELRPQEDEQHSRETRKRGHAPFCTAVVIETVTRLVMCRSHVQKSDYPGKALANVSQLEAVKSLVALLALTGAIVVTFGVDGCTTALGVFTAYILSRWPLAKLGRDNWHKMNDWHTKFETFCSQNTRAYARDRLCPRISELYDTGKLHCYKIKKHFIHCANNCNGSAETFKEMFLGMADYWGDKFDIPDDELVHFRSFLAALLGKDLHLYVNGTHTSLCESFHSLCNKFCPKASVRSFAMYCMLKDLCIIQWNERQLVQTCGLVGDSEQFRKDILNSIATDFN